MTKTLKDTLLGVCENGQNVLDELYFARKSGKDIRIGKDSVKNTVNQLHPEELNLVVSEINDVTKEAKQIRFVSKNGYLPPFEAGQYINIFTEIDGVRTSRPYSISSSPKERAYYEITVARIATGFVSDFLLDNVKAGDEFTANGPSGVFRYVPVFHSKKSVFLAGGSGVTPFKSMISEVLEAGQDREIFLIYGARTQKLALYDGLFKSYAKNHSNFHYTLVLSEQTDGWRGAKGFIDKNIIKKAVKNTDDCTYYICGPQVMNDYCVNELAEMNIPNKKIKREMFGSRQDIVNEPGYPKELSGKEIFKVKVGDRVINAKSGESLLTSLERAGVRIRVCCRSGECSLCRVKLVNGRVYLSKGMLLRYADEKFGYIHSCKAYPISDLEILL